MKTRWAWAAGIVAALLLAAAVGLHLGSISAIDRAKYTDDKFQYDMSVGLMRMFDGFMQPDGSKGTPKAVQDFTSQLPEKGLVYNIIELSADGKVLYKLNDRFLPGGNVVVFFMESRVFLADSSASRVYRLLPKDNEGLLDSIGSAGGIEAIKDWYGDGEKAGAMAAQVNTQYINAINYDANGNIEPESFVFFLYDDATKAFMDSSHTGEMRAAASRRSAMALAALSAYCLLLPLCVFLDAKKLRQKAWLWMCIVLVTNAAGAFVYLVVRSQGFCLSPGSPCRACGAMLRREWTACPRCGSGKEAEE